MNENSMWIMGVIAVLLVIPVKFLVPKMMESGNSGLRFGIGVVLFFVYTAILLLVFAFLNTVPVEGGSTVMDKAYFIRYTLGVLLVNLMALFTAILYFFTREKRKMTETEKMKLKDM